MDDALRIRCLRPGEEGSICAMVARVFDRFVAGQFPPEGIAEFLGFAAPGALRARSGPGQVLLVAEVGGRLAGMIELRDLDHICLLFVELQGRGVGRALLEAALVEARARRPGLARVTVNASPNAEAAYAAMGFVATGPALAVHGITFVPMARTLVPQGA